MVLLWVSLNGTEISNDTEQKHEPLLRHLVNSGLQEIDMFMPSFLFLTIIPSLYSI